MQQTENYLQIMIESLQKKSGILDYILDKNQAQLECIKGKVYEDVDWDAFNLIVAEKQTSIDQINELDEGFSTVYNRVREDVLANKDIYKRQVAILQELINDLTDKGVKIQTGEERNRQIIDGIFLKARKEIKRQRTSVNVASNYYKTMSNSVVRAAEDSQLDHRQ